MLATQQDLLTTQRCWPCSTDELPPPARTGTPLAALHSWAKARARHQADASRALTKPLPVGLNPTEPRFRHWWRPVAWWDYEVDECWWLRGGALNTSAVSLRAHAIAPSFSLSAVGTAAPQASPPSGPSAARSAEGLTLASNPHRASTALRASLARGPPRASGRSLTPNLWEQKNVQNNPFRYTDPSGFCGPGCFTPNPRDAFATEEQYQAWLKGHAAAGEALASAVPVGKALSWLGRFAKGAVAKVVAKVAGKADDVAKVADDVGGRVGEIAERGWKLGAFKSTAKWESQMAKRGWTPAQITEAVQKGERFAAKNVVNKENTATRYVHPETGRSVVIDDVTKEVLHVGDDGFKY
jgi:hypothetical protein